jgi:predicted nuclease with TOPRIM domain
LRQLLSLKDEAYALKDEAYALKDQRSALEKKVTALKDELTALKDSFKSGTYFSHLSDYWKEESVNIEQNWVYSNISWTDYQRTREDAENIQVRQYHSIHQQTGEDAENIEVQQNE